MIKYILYTYYFILMIPFFLIAGAISMLIKMAHLISVETEMTSKSTNEFSNFIDTLVDELITTPDEQVLEGIDPAAIQAGGLRLLQLLSRKLSLKMDALSPIK